MSERSIPQPPMPEQPPVFSVAQKIRFTRLALETGAMPVAQQLQAAVETPLIIAGNAAAETAPDSPVQRWLSEYAAFSDQDAPFEAHTFAARIYDKLTERARTLDVIDAAVVLKSFAALSFSGRMSKARQARLEELYTAFSIYVAGAIPMEALGLTDELPLDEILVRLHGQDYDALPPMLRMRYFEASTILEDRKRLAYFAQAPEWQQRLGYNRPLSAKEERRINEEAAKTIEGLHRLKAYGITPAIVPGASVGTPCDIWVLPPRAPGSGSYAPGAVAEFMLYAAEGRLAANQVGVDPQTGVPEITLHEPTAMRFRLHDDGRISYGFFQHNIPSDVAEEVFDEQGCRPGFVRLRALLIAIAFDAVVPEEVVRGPSVGGSVASRFTQPDVARSREPIVDLLLRRRRTLGDAGISRTNSQPRDWPPARQHGVGGHFRPLPAGMRPRPTAEEEARAWHEARELPFSGMPPGKTWVNDYERGTEPPPTPFRRARFSRTSATRQLGFTGVQSQRKRRR